MFKLFHFRQVLRDFQHAIDLNRCSDSIWLSFIAFKLYEIIAKIVISGFLYFTSHFFFFVRFKDFCWVLKKVCVSLFSSCPSFCFSLLQENTDSCNLASLFLLLFTSCRRSFVYSRNVSRFSCYMFIHLLFICVGYIIYVPQMEIWLVQLLDEISFSRNNSITPTLCLETCLIKILIIILSIYLAAATDLRKLILYKVVIQI